MKTLSTTLLVLASSCLSLTNNNAFHPFYYVDAADIPSTRSAIATSLEHKRESTITRKQKDKTKYIERTRDNKRPSIFHSITQNFTDIDTQIVDYGGQHPFELYQQQQQQQQRQMNTIRKNHDSQQQQQQQQHRQLDETGDNIFGDGFTGIRIHVDSSHIHSTVNTPDDELRQEALDNYIMPNVLSNWSHYVAVLKPATQPIKVPESACFNMFKESNSYDGLPETYKSNGVADTDIVLLLSQFEFVQNQLVCPMDGEKEGDTLAAATWCSLDQFDRPIIGFINLCLNKIKIDTDDAGGKFITQKSKDKIVGVLIHEVAHALGLNADSLKYFRDVKTGEPLTPRPFKSETVTCVDGKRYDNVIMPSEKTIRRVETRKGSGLYFEVVTSQVQQVVRNQFNCQEMIGARLENQPTGFTCFGAHFDERLYYTESLSAIYAEEADYFSALTLAFLEDTGWYKPNYRGAEISPFGHGAGCDFVNEECILGGRVPDYSKGFFCNKVRENYGTEMEKNDYICDPSHTHKALCDLRRGVEPPEDYQVFPEKLVGPTVSTMDWCPVALDEVVSCHDPDMKEAHGTLLGEEFGPESKCFETTVDDRGSLCLKSSCNEATRTLEVTMNGQTLSCDRDFKTITFKSSESFVDLLRMDMWVSVQCPRLAAACPSFFCPSNCAGKGVCNYNLTTPKCECFNKNDTTAGCYSSDPVPATIPKIDTQEKSNGGIGFSVLSAASRFCSLAVAVILLLSS